MTLDSFGAVSDLVVGDERYGIFRLDAVLDDPRRLPYSLRILLENLLAPRGRCQRDRPTTSRALADRHATSGARSDAASSTFMPARVLMQDFTGVPAIVDLAAMRDAVVALGGRAPIVSIPRSRSTS